MLTIHEGFPIKKMALYGSAAFIVGFTGTLTMLREYVSKDESGNISVVHPSNKQEAKSNVSNQVPKTEKNEDGKTLDPAAPLTSSTQVTGGGIVSTRQASPIPITTSNTSGATNGGTMTVTPAAPAPAPTVSSAPAPSGGSSGYGSTSTTTTTTTQPAPTTTQPTNPLPIVPNLQQTVNNLSDSTGLLP